MVKVPFGQVHINFAQKTVPAKGVMVPDGENEGLSSEVLHTKPILMKEQEREVLLKALYVRPYVCVDTLLYLT